MKICFFGSYDRNYARNRILIAGLQENNCQVYHCHSAKGLFLTRYPQLVRNFWKIRKNIDVIYVAFFGHLNMPLAYLLGKVTGKKVVFDAFYSMYDTYVYDRRTAKEGSIRAWSYFLIDKLACHLADVIICDTYAHAQYFIKTFKVNKKKFKRVFVGADDTVFRPRRKRKRKSTRKLIIEFHGYFSRLSGAEYFIKAAKLLEHKSNLEFWLIGDAASYRYPKELLNKLKPKNLLFLGKQTLEQLAKLVAKADISVGHLGDTNKARNVISNKTYHALACGNAVIVANTPANRELLEDGKNCLMVKIADEQDLVKKIIYLAENDDVREKIGAAGLQLFCQYLTNKFLARKLIKVILSDKS